MQDYNSTINQKIKSKFVERNVIHCASYLVSHLSSNYEAMDGSYYSYEDVLDLCSKPRGKVCDDQYRYVIDCDERGEFRSTVYKIDGNDDDVEVYNFDIANEDEYEAINEEIGNIREEWDIETYLKDQGIIPKHATVIGADDETEFEEMEALEHWIVSNWLGDKLKEKGEMVGELFDFDIWGRTCSGQAILLDSVISEICSDLEILEGQRNEWDV